MGYYLQITHHIRQTDKIFIKCTSVRYTHYIYIRYGVCFYYAVLMHSLMVFTVQKRRKDTVIGFSSFIL